VVGDERATSMEDVKEFPGFDGLELTADASTSTFRRTGRRTTTS
jgi:hypothetical protein